MRNFILSISAIILLLSLTIFQSCTSDICNETLSYNRFDAVFMTEHTLRNIKIESPRTLEDPGKIYVYGKYLFINERYKGIHILDNSDLSNPVAVSFISIPGNVDMAVRNGVLYADNFIDVISIDISNPVVPVIVYRNEHVFKRHKNNLGYRVYFKATGVVEEIECTNVNFGDDFFVRGNVLFDSNQESTGGNKSNGQSIGNGQGGSMARFTLVEDRLYTVDNRDLNIFNVSNGSAPILVNTVNVGWGIETIFPYKNNLFLGSNTGVYIFDNSDKDNPSLLSKFQHARVCDPVYVQGDIAYVTLRDGNRCNGFLNQLDVLDISSLSNPKLIKSYPMSNPHGLTVLDDKMILCEGQFGLKVLDVSNSKKIKEKSTIKNTHFYDAIGLSKDHIILTGENGIFQYKLDGNKLEQLGAIYAK